MKDIDMNKWLLPLTQVSLVVGRKTEEQKSIKTSLPVLDLYDYFSGTIQAWGLFEDRFGRVRRQFHVEIEGEIDKGALVLVENFLYDDGEQDQRVWRIDRDGPGSYIGRAADVVGYARGSEEGNKLNWRYDMDLRIGEKTLRVSFNDWMYLQTEDVLINRAKVRKFGLEVGSVSLFFKKNAL
jgi:hypothetical protein